MYAIDWAQVWGRAQTRHPRQTAGLLSRVSPVVWSLGFTSLLTDISSEMVTSILPMYLVVHLRVSPVAFGIIDGLYQGVSALLRVTAGFIGDRWRHHKRVAAVGYGLSAVCKLGLLAAGNGWTAIASIIALDRTGKGIRTAPRDALITLNSDARDLASAFGVHRALDAAGAMLGPLVAFLILAVRPSGFDIIFVASCCIAVIGVGVLLLFVDAPRPRAVPAGEPKASPQAAIRLLRDPGFRSVAVAAGALNLATISDAFVFVVLQQRIGFSVVTFPLLYIGVSVVNCMIAVPGGAVADRWGRVRVFLGGHALLLALYALLLLPGGNLARVVLCVLLLGAYYAATDGVLSALLGAALPPHLCGSGLALVATATNGSRLGSSVLFGILWTAIGVNAAIGLFTLGLGVALAGAVWILTRVGKTDGYEHSTA